MIRFVNKLTGSIMLVADGRKEEYLSAGHKLAAGPDDAPDPAGAELEPAKAPAKRKTAGKTTGKRATK